MTNQERDFLAVLKQHQIELPDRPLRLFDAVKGIFEKQSDYKNFPEEDKRRLQADDELVDFEVLFERYNVTFGSRPLSLFLDIKGIFSPAPKVSFIIKTKRPNPSLRLVEKRDE